MIIEEIDQGTEAWKALRRGVPTASCFSKILTATTLKLSESRDKYMNQLAAESVGLVDEWEGNQHTKRGNELEDEAVLYYEFINDVTTRKVGFVWKDERKLVGGSPDRLVGEDGGLEIKCKISSLHIGCLRSGNIPAEYIGQIYGCLWLTGRSYWDFLSYHAGFVKQFEARITKDNEGYQRWLDRWEREIEQFCERLEMVKQMTHAWVFGE